MAKSKQQKREEALARAESHLIGTRLELANVLAKPHDKKYVDSRQLWVIRLREDIRGQELQIKRLKAACGDVMSL